MTDLESKMMNRDLWSRNSQAAAGRASGSILDYVRITEPCEPIKMLCSPGWTYTPAIGVLHRMNCKRRTCEDCGWFWAWRWRKALKEKAVNDLDLHKRKADKALTLTFAQNVPYITMQDILRQFWRLLRRAYPGVEYWGVVEFNQSHTIPHLHFILANAPYIELDYLDYAWRVAQKRYKLEHLAWNLRIEKIRKNTEAYFTKYVTKLLGGKDEIPRRENWGGRFVRYSTKFFPIPVNAMLAGKKFADKLAANDDLDRVFWRVREPHQGIGLFKIESAIEDAAIERVTRKTWEPAIDKLRASSVPPPDLFTGIETIPVFYGREFCSELYYALASYNRASSTGRYGPAF